MFLRISLFVLLTVPGLIDPAWAAEAAVSAPQIVSRIDEAQPVTLQGNTPYQARPENDLGRVADSLPLPGLQLALRRPALQERLVEKLIRDQLDRKSTRYHRWISADEYGWRFGVAIQDVNRIVSWLSAQGFTVKNVSRSRMRIDFSGTAGEVREAFHTEIHRLHVHGEDHIANMSDPQIPAALAPAIAGIAWLNDFRPKPQYTGGLTCQPYDKNNNWAQDNTCYSVVPADLEKIYNFPPVSSYDGTGQTIAVMEHEDPLSNQDWCDFRAEFFGETMCKTALFNVVHPNNCNDPGPNGLATEVLIDSQWASGAAPGATINVVSCADNGTTPGYLIALENYVGGEYPPAIISMSFGFCEASLLASGNSVLNNTYQQATIQGFSVFVAAGDAGAALCDWASGNGYATQGIAVSGYASSPYVVAVGGTTFADWAQGTETSYWNSSNNPQNWGSARSYIPEIPWNSSCGNWLLALFYNFKQTYGQHQFCNSQFPNGKSTFNVVEAGSGGPSACAIYAPDTACAGYPKQSWQSGILGNPGDGVRDVPDVSIVAGGSEWGHYLVYCNTPDRGQCTAKPPNNWEFSGGTSFSAPIFAGIQALIDQRVGENGGNPAVGNPNPNYYAFAKSEYGQNGNTNCLSTRAAAGNSCIFYDITYLNMHDDSTIVVPCKPSNVGPINCYLDGATVGVLTTDKTSLSYVPAYSIHSQFGWDFTTGIGSPNVTNLVNAWPVP